MATPPDDQHLAVIKTMQAFLHQCEHADANQKALVHEKTAAEAAAQRAHRTALQKQLSALYQQVFETKLTWAQAAPFINELSEKLRAIHGETIEEIRTRNQGY